MPQAPTLALMPYPPLPPLQAEQTDEYMLRVFGPGWSEKKKGGTSVALEQAIMLLRKPRLDNVCDVQQALQLITAAKPGAKVKSKGEAGGGEGGRSLELG